MEIDDLKLMTEVTKEVASEAYKDGLKPSVQEAGKLLARPLKIINTCFQGIDIWLEKRDYNLKKTKVILAEKIKNIPEDKLTTPEPYIAVPALEAISYSMDNEQLKNMYANLLARAMLKSEQSKVHPSFVEIIKQLSPNDALLFKEIMEREYSPIIHLSVVQDIGNNDYRYNLNWKNNYNESNVSLSNLQRLGLIEIPFGKWYLNDKVYDIVRQTKSYNDIVKKLREQYPQNELYEDKSCVNTNALSKSFYEVCLDDDIRYY
ncbi:DUF4393 domain-containing protein [Streptococcus equinus]|uniref:DUF4393 domain-containing protein n=1 Tax=Streptococcus equinus TaxID=1335 RepID=UPI00087ED673|nr:DUF4393 domain-containing protein [Streptococcus equinus]SDQ14181.1 protein of unknown function [Streptococcus equinus]SEN57345.1 protein of unknown function [Streptococcus equinus]